MLGWKVSATSLRECDIDHRHDRAAQIEYPHQEHGSQWHLSHGRPFHNLFHIEHRETKTLATGAKDAILPFREPLFGSIAGDCRSLGRLQWFELLVIVSHCNRSAHYAPINFTTCPKSSSALNGFTTYPSAPCCCAQNLSLSVFFEVTSTTGIRANSVWLFNSRHA